MDSLHVQCTVGCVQVKLQASSKGNMKSVLLRHEMFTDTHNYEETKASLNMVHGTGIS